MRILYLDHTGQIGGGELSLLTWLRESPEAAHVLLFEDGPFRALLEKEGIAVDVFPAENGIAIRRDSGVGAILGALPGILRFRKRLRERTAAADVLYANSQKAFFLAALVLRRRQKLVWHLRDILTAAHFSRSLRMIAVATANVFASVVIANSQATADSFVSAGGRRGKIRVVYPGIDPASFDAVDEDAAHRLREELWPGAELVAGIFGRVTDWKGQHVLLDAIADLPRYQVVVVGDALFGEEIYKSGLVTRVDQPDLRGRVHFLGFRTDVAALMRAIDVAVHASVAAEPFGRVIVEGMLAGKPVIATRAGGAAEIIQDGVDGLLVSPGSVAEMRAALVRLAEDPEYRRRLAAKGRERAERLYSVDALISGTAAVLRELGDPSA